MPAQIPLSFKIFLGDDVDREVTLRPSAPGVIKIGKLEGSQLRLDHESVSRMHAVIEISEAGEVQILDLGSTRGTYMNGEKISKAMLRDGDTIVIGEVKIAVGIGQLSEQKAPARQRPTGASAPVQGSALQGGRVPPPAVVPPAGVMPWSPLAGAAAQPTYQPTTDATLYRQDGSRAIEVTALFRDSVLQVRQLDRPQGGKVSSLTWMLFGAGILVFVGGLVAHLARQHGIGALLNVVGLIPFVYAVGRRLDEEQSPNFTLGEALEADVHVVHEAVPDSCFPLVRSDGTQYALLYTTGMQGDVIAGSQRSDLGELASSGRAQRVADFPNTFSYVIPQDAQAHVRIGEASFLISSLPPAQPVITPFFAPATWSAQGANLMSAAAHALVLFLVFAIPPDAKSLSLDLFSTDNEFLQYLTKPLEEKKEDLPDFLKKKGPDEAGGKGQRHKDEEGKMGKKDSTKKTGLYGLKGPADNPDPHLAKRLAEEAAQNAGVLGVLKGDMGSHLASAFGRDTALGTDAEDALGGLIGDQIGESYGVGGLGLVGSGRGGGGTGEGTIGLGSLGTIGKGGGGGDGAGYGRGAGRLGGRKARQIAVLAGQAQVRGALDKEIIRRVIRRHIREVRYCYEKELLANEQLGGRVAIQFTIAATGQVVVSTVQESTVGNPAVEQCIAQAVRRWEFPKPKGGGIVIVSYPFVLRASGT